MSPPLPTNPSDVRSEILIRRRHALKLPFFLTAPLQHGNSICVFLVFPPPLTTADMNIGSNAL